MLLVDVLLVLLDEEVLLVLLDEDVLLVLVDEAPPEVLEEVLVDDVAPPVPLLEDAAPPVPLLVLVAPPAPPLPPVLPLVVEEWVELLAPGCWPLEQATPPRSESSASAAEVVVRIVRGLLGPGYGMA